MFYKMEITTNITKEHHGLEELKYLLREFLKSEDGHPKVREYLSSAIEDKPLLLAYLQGRKYSVDHAWKTLKRQAEVRFIEYPEVFQESTPDFILPFIRDGIFGLLKARDQKGRRIICYNMGKWNPDEISVQKIATAGTFFLDLALREKDSMISNGLIFIQNNSGVGMKHVKAYTLPDMLRIWNIYYHAYPVKVKGVYYVNVPYYCQFIYKIMKPFVTKKFKERLIISTTDKGFEVLHQNVSPTILPKFLGGVLENEEAFDKELLGLIK
ncbi:Retinaldehyde-binding protein 1 [Orchesella cincta]|uniref:Retinaldehyde-binding protein 1 n=1 Tax=Orchesella cincta TaxID=48709 RepID=A0A1D2M7L1_ORCCI|nr:Retinaldehyde-binding protein 1 [Orchesella cincta]